ncbi:BglG family transcription antiterminator [Cryobacterium frigoriphilum]|nr:PRD domain-containing protein [Cryobacterium frigoriphilum]
MSDKATRMLEYLAHTPAWVTAAEIADHLGVTPRSVRSYVTQVKTFAHPLSIIESGPAGYRLNRQAYSRLHEAATPHPPDAPTARLYRLVRQLTDATGGLDVYELAASVFVADSTLEADLTRLRALLVESGLTLSRHGSIVTLEGSETDRRRLLSRMFREEGTRGLLELEAIQAEFAADSLGAFKTDLLAMLDAQGYFVNEFGTTALLLHVAIAVDRVSRRPGPAVPVAGRSGAATPMAEQLGVLLQRHFRVTLDAHDLDFLALLLATRVVTPGHDQPAGIVAANYVRPGDLAVVRRIVAQASAEYLVDLEDEGFIVRLTLHVRNLIDRAQHRSYSRNPLTRSIKTAYPMTYELAVYIASALQAQEHITITDDEIAYIAMHVGAHLELQGRREELVTCIIVCPNYYDVHLLLQERIERLLGTDLEVVTVVTRSDVEWSALHADLVLTTIDPQLHGDGVIVIQPFLTAADVDRIRLAASRVRRLRRRAQITGDLLKFFDEGLFLRNFYPRGELAMIRALGERMQRLGLIDQAYVDGAIDRERMSSTAFTDHLAVPHAMAMTARQTSIAIVINDAAMDWGETRVNVVAFIAFSAAGRSSFQAVFDQFVEVFADRADVQRLIKRSVDFEAFIGELAHLMDQ